jgi:plasmid maintenance system antidote protein VapI
VTETEPMPRPAFAYIAAFLERNGLSKEQFADKIHLPVDRVTPVLNGTRLISHECAFAIGQAFPQLKADGLLHAQAKWRLHQLAHPELYTADQQPKKTGARRSESLDVEKVKRLYLSDTPMREITEETKASLSTIYGIIDEAGIPRRGPGRSPRHVTPPPPRNPPHDEESDSPRSD